jgi:hypothetical protein
MGKTRGDRKRLVYVRGGSSTCAFSWGLGTLPCNITAEEDAQCETFLGLSTHNPITCLIYLYNILGWSSFPSIRPVIHPSKFLIPEKENDGRGGGGRMAAVAVYPNVYVLQSCSLWKTPLVLQFAKSYKLIFKN